MSIGPAPDGTMPPVYYERCDELAKWMAHSRDSLIGAGPTPGDDRSNVLITSRVNTWYLHVPPDHKGPVNIHTDKAPRRVSLLRTGESLDYTFDNATLKISIPSDKTTKLFDVVAVRWK